ncbi:hypothetical protein GH714_019068 [Hevea brasiliensis]|uniref:Apple domain-containing protein n=1 Tax=Hevea brasiliensis TaxID=3981 RepID=A0A6A6LR67_HEVBR|nr:hypothetical protein GH714_019068 [Hevea brasiliensis]
MQGGVLNVCISSCRVADKEADMASRDGSTCETEDASSGFNASDNDPSIGILLLVYFRRNRHKASYGRDQNLIGELGSGTKQVHCDTRKIRKGADYQSGLTLIEGPEPGIAYVTLSALRNCSNLRYVISPTGVLRLLCWMIGTGWYARWEAPVTPCEVYGACGPFGVCQRYEPNLTCRCLKGFVPMSSEEWRKGNWTGGCIRRTELSCGRNTSSINTQGGKPDGFLKIGGLKLPDFSYFLKVFDENECHELCLNNCSCSGYANVNGIGCLVWTGNLLDMHEMPFDGQDLNIRLAHKELNESDQKIKVKIIISVITVSIITLIGAMIYCFMKCRVNRRAKTNGELLSIKKGLVLARFRDFKEIVIESDSSSAVRHILCDEEPLVIFAVLLCDSASCFSVTGQLRFNMFAEKGTLC